MFHCFLHGSCKGQCSSKVISCTCSNSSFESVLIVLAGLTGPLTVENPGQSQMVWVDLVKPNAAAANPEPLEQHVGVVERAGRQAHIWIFLFFFRSILDFSFPDGEKRNEMEFRVNVRRKNEAASQTSPTGNLEGHDLELANLE